jgi:HlyD family secretion protein
MERVRQLYQRNASSRQEYDDQRLKYQQAEEVLNQAKAQLNAMRAIRPTDVQAAEADLMQAQAALTVTEADLQATEVLAPRAGRILRIHTHPGERIGDQGIVEVGETDVMYAVAEVYEEDISKVQTGQPARIRVPALHADLAGDVVRKDLVVGRKVILNNDPVADTDARVVEVHIRLSPADSRKVAGLSNARVEVLIDVNGGTR